jgi:hypothetical protein
MYKYKEISNVEQMEVGKIYSDIDPNKPEATFFRLKEIGKSILFEHIGGPDHYRNINGAYLFNNPTSLWYEILNYNEVNNQ